MNAHRLPKESETEFALLLERRRRELIEEIQAKVAEAKAERVAPDASASIDGGDRAFLDLTSEIDLTIAGRDVEELRDIDAALGRLRDGTFGTCVECGGGILPARLRAWPGASRCTDCQERLEEARSAGHAPRL